MSQQEIEDKINKIPQRPLLSPKRSEKLYKSLTYMYQQPHKSELQSVKQKKSGNKLT